MTKTNIDKELVNTLAKLLHENDLTEIEYDTDGVRLKVVANRVQNIPSVTVAPAVSDGTKDKGESAAMKDIGFIVKSPMVGVIYSAPEPGGAPYVKEGGNVKEGQTLFLIEAMKTFNAVKAPCAGKIKKIMVQDAQPVEYDEALLSLE